MTNPLVWFNGLQVFHFMVLTRLSMVLVMLVLIMVLLLITMLIFHQNQHKMIYQILVVLNWHPRFKVHAKFEPCSIILKKIGKFLAE
jgi:hypothetical protein